MIDHEIIDHYLAKWHRREPEMLQAEVFCRPGQRPAFRLFGCLLAEWEDALLTTSDPQVASGKLIWWAEELAAGGKRHPLARDLNQAGIATPALASAPLAAAQLLESTGSSDLQAALLRCRSYAEAMAAAQRHTQHAGSGSGAPGNNLTGGLADDISISLLRRAAMTAAAGHPLARDLLPMNLLARHSSGERDAVTSHAFHRDLARELLAASVSGTGLPLFRALRQQFDRYRLKALAALPAVAQVDHGEDAEAWTAWRNEAAAGLGPQVIPGTWSK